MAKIFFVGLDGTEKSYRLQTHRPFTVGRDPGNDIILRDPKVSRHHAEIVFEGELLAMSAVTMPEGPFGEFTGYYASEARPAPVMQVSATYHRDDPILLGSKTGQR